jgi:MGT family glycosyltransferase
VTLFGVPDIKSKVSSSGLTFVEIGAGLFPLGTTEEMYKTLGELSSLEGIKYTIQWLAQETNMLCAEAPAAIQAAGINLLIIDQLTVIGGTIADHLKLPFVTVCNALPINREPGVPPFFTTWTYQTNWWSRWRNQLGNSLVDYLSRKVWQLIVDQRQLWGLPPYANRDASYSQLAQICQLPPDFDFPRENLSPKMHFTGPLQDPSGRESVRFKGTEFPFERLTGQPLIYASMGTLQNRRKDIFSCIATACHSLDIQLVVSLGNPNQNPADFTLVGQPIVVSYAPQQLLIERASLVISHGGLNTVLGSLRAAVPLVVIPITNEQPGIATRVLRTGAGQMVTLQQLNASRLKTAVNQVLEDNYYRLNAQKVQAAIQAAGGVKKAADIIIQLPIN